MEMFTRVPVSFMTELNAVQFQAVAMFMALSDKLTKDRFKRGQKAREKVLSNAVYREVKSITGLGDTKLKALQEKALSALTNIPRHWVKVYLSDVQNSLLTPLEMKALIAVRDAIRWTPKDRRFYGIGRSLMKKMYGVNDRDVLNRLVEKKLLILDGRREKSYYSNYLKTVPVHEIERHMPKRTKLEVSPRETDEVDCELADILRRPGVDFSLKVKAAKLMSFHRRFGIVCEPLIRKLAAYIEVNPENKPMEVAPRESDRELKSMELRKLQSGKTKCWRWTRYIARLASVERRRGTLPARYAWAEKVLTFERICTQSPSFRNKWKATQQHYYVPPPDTFDRADLLWM